VLTGFGSLSVTIAHLSPVMSLLGCCVRKFWQLGSRLQVKAHTVCSQDSISDAADPFHVLSMGVRIDFMMC
jgi:predicted helicase